MTNHHTKIDGYFNFEAYYKRIAEEHLTDASIAVEVGVYKGKSIMYMAEKLHALGRRVDLYGVDTFAPTGEGYRNLTTPDALLSEYLRNTRQMRDMITTLVMPSVHAARSFADHSLDFVFIDAAHDYQSVKADIHAWTPKLRRGGIIAGHDFHHAPVAQAVRDVFTDSTITHHEGTVWEVRI